MAKLWDKPEANRCAPWFIFRICLEMKASVSVSNELYLIALSLCPDYCLNLLQASIGNWSRFVLIQSIRDELYSTNRFSCTYHYYDKHISDTVAAVARTENRRMTVDRKLTFFTVRHEIRRLFRLYSLVNQGQPRYANWVTHRWPQSMYASGMKMHFVANCHEI